MTSPTPRVLIADKFDQAGIDGLNALGCSVHVDPDLGPDTLPGAIKATESDVLVVRSTKVPATVLDTCPDLCCVIRAGAGHDNIDSASAGSHGIPVCNTPGMNAVAVAELTMGHLITLDRRIGEQTIGLRAGNWNKAEFGKARGLKGRTLLVLGLGAIGIEVAKRAQAFGMTVWAQSRSLREDTATALGIRLIPYTRDALYNALAEVDAVCIHVASTPDTRGLCDERFFNAMKPGSFFVNTSRGDIVDEVALIRVANEKDIRVGVDVYQDQPAQKHCEWSTRLAEIPGAALTHHCGASTDQAQSAVAEEVVEIVKSIIETGTPRHIVNASALAGASGQPAANP
ncbi:MAG: NAD(P)-dependent oxidoreductase [Phycisphaerales bacterium]